jgi:hypothetical protein
MAVTIEYDSVRVAQKAHRAVALPIYTISLILSFLMMWFRESSSQTNRQTHVNRLLTI